MRTRNMIGSLNGRALACRLPMAAVAVLAPSAALAQQAPKREFSISPQLRLVHDDNVLRLPDGVTRNGLRNSDYRATPQVQVNIVRPIGRHQVFATGIVGYDFYRYNKQLNRERIELTGGGAVAMTNCTVNGQISYIRRQSNLDDIFLGGLTRGNNRETFVSPSTGISCGSAGGISSSLSYTHDDVENSDPLRQFGDYHANTYNAQVGISRPSIGNVGIYTNYRRGVYDNRVFGTGEKEAVKSYAVGLRVDRQFGRIKGHVAGGVTKVDSNTPGVRGFRGGTYDVSLTYLAPRLTVGAAFSRGVQQSNLLGVNYSITDLYAVDATYKLSPRISLNAGASHQRRRLASSPLTPNPLGNRNDKLRTYNVGATFDAGRHISFDAGASWRQRRGQLPIFDYNARVLSLTLRLH